MVNIFTFNKEFVLKTLKIKWNDSINNDFVLYFITTLVSFLTFIKLKLKLFYIIHYHIILLTNIVLQLKNNYIISQLQVLK